MLIASTYKFYLAIENSILRDYCTEKFFQGFMTSSAMVFLFCENSIFCKTSSCVTMTSTVMVPCCLFSDRI